MIVSVIGLGYIGLPTAAVLASNGLTVIGVDVNQNKVDIINQGKTYTVEPELDILVQTTVQSGFLKATTNPVKASVFMVAVPTPFIGDHEPDLSYIESAVKAIAPVLEKGNLVILESTSPVGATEMAIEWMKEERPDLSFPEFCNNTEKYDIAVAHCPERVLPGRIIHELINNDRIIGGVTTKCGEKARDLYNVFVEAHCLITDCRTAELSKLVENSFRDVNIAFANELSLICDKLDINVWEMIKLSNHHPRVNILQPGPGVGGHCIAVDPWFIVNSAPTESKLIHTARLVNDRKPDFILEKINQSVKVIAKKKSEIKIACFGLTFKPDIDDLRESPALHIAKLVNLMKFNEVLVVEPNISQLPKGFNMNSTKLSSIEKTLKIADIVVLLVDHREFKSIDLSLLSGKQIVDTRGIWS
ncbi:UDP-N-acetyl-D-mannosamine dehydrogenase [Candidatus Thioglobus sp.]|nr:UDP-N-acetyl-D-mannosamine dehydrogenase [Candidatus Thioglobus sp.]